jgi:hypothetical protein
LVCAGILGGDDNMVRRIGWLVVALALLAAPAVSAAQAGGKIAGIVHDAAGQSLPNARLQLRNVDTAQIVARTRAAADAAYEFAGVAPGNYLVEIVDDAGRVIGLSSAAALVPNGAVTGLIAALTASTAGAGAFFASTGGILLLLGIAGGVTAGIIAATNDASPSR